MGRGDEEYQLEGASSNNNRRDRAKKAPRGPRVSLVVSEVAGGVVVGWGAPLGRCVVIDGVGGDSVVVGVDGYNAVLIR